MTVLSGLHLYPYLNNKQRIVGLGRVLIFINLGQRPAQQGGTGGAPIVGESAQYLTGVRYLGIEVAGRVDAAGLE